MVRCQRQKKRAEFVTPSDRICKERLILEKISASVFVRDIQNDNGDTDLHLGSQRLLLCALALCQVYSTTAEQAAAADRDKCLLPAHLRARYGEPSSEIIVISESSMCTCKAAFQKISQISLFLMNLILSLAGRRTNCWYAIGSIDVLHSRRLIEKKAGARDARMA